MSSEKKTKAQMASELAALRERVAELEGLETQRRLQEEVARRKIRELDSFINNLPDMAWLKDVDSNFVAANKAFGKAVGMEPEYLLGNSCEVCFGKEKAREFRQDDQKVMDGKRQVTILETIPDALGNEVYLETIKSPMFDEAGAVVGTVGVARDITRRRQMEEKLRESEERYRLLADNATDVIWTLDMDFRCTYVSPSVTRQRGYSVEEVMAQTLEEMLTPSSLKIAMAALAEVQTVQRSGQSQDWLRRLELELRRRDGSTVWTEMQISVLRDQSGKLVGLQGITRDISERRKSEAALQEAHDELENRVKERTADLKATGERLQYRVELETLVSSISTDFIDMPPGEVDLRIDRALHQIGAFSGVDRGYVFLLAGDGTVASNTHEWCAAGTEPQIANLQGLLIDAYPWLMAQLSRFETIHVPRTGDLPPEATAEKEILQAQNVQSLLLVPMSYRGDLVGFLGFDAVRKEMAWGEEDASLLKAVGEVITSALKRRSADDALRESEEQFRSMVATCFDGVLIHHDNTILEVSRPLADRLGYSREELLGNEALGIVAPESRDQAMGIVRSGHDAVYELVGEMKDGTRIPLEVITSSCTHRGKRARMTAFRDISDRKRAEREMVSLERLRAIGEMSGGVSHNLNNLLTGMLGPAQLMKMETQDPRILRECNTIIASALRATDLVDRLHRSVRAVREGIQPVSVSEIAANAVEATSPVWKDEAESRGISVEVAQDFRTDTQARGVPGGLLDVVVNMILNAVAAMPEGGQVRLETYQRSDEVLLDVRDSGTGMDSETARRVFEPFFTTKADVGSGLGLSTALTMVTGWGGTIDVKSELGKGTTFSIRLLSWPDSETAIVKSVPAGEGRTRILVVDDEPGICSFIARLLGETYDVETATSGHEALEKFSPGQYGAALIDLGMPGVPGDELARQLRSVDPGLATVLVTGWSLEEGDPRLGPFDIEILKPIRDLGLLKEQTARAIRLHEERRRVNGP